MTVNLSDVKAYWCKSNNFGDALTPWILAKLTGKPVEYTEPSNRETVYMITGSILNWKLTNAVVWGCGLANMTDMVNKDYKEIRAVRGPFTARIAKENSDVMVPDVYGDPALLLPRWYNPPISKKYRLGIIPHCIEYHNVVNRLDYLPEDVIIIDLLSQITAVIDVILSCEVCISSSLHGIIASHAYGIPCRHIIFTNKVLGDGVKFFDYYRSVGIPYQKPLNLSGKASLEIGQLLNYMYKCDTINLDIDLDRLYRANPFHR